MAVSPLAARVAALLRRDARPIDAVFASAHEEADKNLAAELSQKWGREIKSRFSREFPDWDITAEIVFEDMARWQDRDYFRVTLGVSPSSRHPDVAWLYELDLETGKAMDAWFASEFGLYPSFQDTAMDMARGTRSFPAYNGAGIRIYW